MSDNKMSLLQEFNNKYPNVDMSKFKFVSDSYGGYIYWKYNRLTVISYDDISGKTWTEDISSDLKVKLHEDLGIHESFPDSLKLTNKSIIKNNVENG